MTAMMFDIQPMVEAHRSRRVGEVAWELCKLGAFMDRYDDSEVVEYIDDEDERGPLLDLPRV